MWPNGAKWQYVASGLTEISRLFDDKANHMTPGPLTLDYTTLLRDIPEFVCTV